MSNIKKIKFILFTAFRFLKAKKRSRKIASSMLSIAGLGAGIMTLTVVIGIMNGLQLSFIEPILNVNSYHIQISGDEIPPETVEKIKKVPGLIAFVPFVEYQAILEGERPCIIRGIPADVMELDPVFRDSFKDLPYQMPIEEHLREPGSIVLGNLLSSVLYLSKGERVQAITLSSNPSINLRVKGIFKTGFYNIDFNFGFVSLETAQLMNSSFSRDDLTYGIKLSDHFGDQQAARALQNILGDSYEVLSWRVFNSNFFGALLTEKVMMMVVIGLIFILVAFNIYHSLKRSVYERSEEIALFKALGAPSSVIKNIFLMEGFLIGLLGVLVGFIPGLLITYNINEVFRFIEVLVNNNLFPVVEKLMAPFTGPVRLPPISIFSSNVFYIEEVPVRVLLQEAVFINIFAIFSCIAAAWFASKKIISFKPAQILRCE